MNIEEQLAAWERRRWVSVEMLADLMEVKRHTVRNWWNSGETCLEAWMALNDVRFIKFTAVSAIRFVRENFRQPGTER